MAKRRTPFVPSTASITGQSQTATAAANTVVTLTVAAIANEVRGVDMIDASYDLATAAGTLTVTVGVTTVYETNFVGSVEKSFPHSLYIPPNTALTVTLSAVSGQIGRINLVQHPANVGLAGVGHYPHRSFLGH